MAIKTACPNCEKSYTLADNLAGKQVRCKDCSESFTVRAPKPKRRDEDEDEDRPAKAGGTRKRPARRRDEDEDEDDRDYEEDRPRRRAGKRGGIPLWVWLTGGGVAALLLIGLVVVLILALGGNSKVNKENFAKLKAGMTEDEVKAILGKPSEGADSKELEKQMPAGLKGMGGLDMKVLVWRNGDSQIAVTFMGGKAMGLDGRNLK